MKRFWFAVEHEAALYLRPAIVTGLGVATLTLVFSLLAWVRAITPLDLFAVYQPVMPLWGALLTGAIFGELADDSSAMEYLLRPIPSWIKVAAKLTVSLLGYWVVGTVVFFLASGVGAGLYLLVGTDAAFPLATTTLGAWLGVFLRTLGATFWEYLHLHALAFFGAVYFRSRGAAGKTLLSMAVIGLTLVIVWGLAARAIFAPLLSGIDSVQAIEATVRTALEALPPWLRDPQPLIAAGRMLVTAALWGLSALRLRETEVLG